MHKVVTGLQEVRNSAWETIKTSDQKVEIGWDKKCFLGRWSLLSGRRSLTRSYEGWSNIEVWLYFEFDGKLFSNFVWFLFQPIISAFFVPRLFSPAYSRSFDYRRLVEGDPCTNDNGRYMRINMDECRENKNSQMECPAMADYQTRKHSSTRKLAGFLMLFYCSQSLSISKLFSNGKNLRAENFISYY